MTTIRISGGVAHNLPADLRKALASDVKALAAWDDNAASAKRVDLLDHLRQEK